MGSYLVLGCAVAMVGALFNVTSKTLAATGDVELLTGRLISVGNLDVSAPIPAIPFSLSNFSGDYCGHSVFLT
jgi:hypothetical protein